MAHSANEIPVSHKQLQDEVPKVVRSSETELGIYQPGVGNMAQLKPESIIKSTEHTLRQVVRSAGEVVLETVKTTEKIATSCEHLGLDLVRMAIRTNNFIADEVGRTIQGTVKNTVAGTVDIASEVLKGASQVTKTGLQDLHDIHQMNLNLGRDLIGSLFRGFNPLKSREKSTKKDATVIPITIQDN